MVGHIKFQNRVFYKQLPWKAAVNGDQKPSFLRAKAKRVHAWQTKRIPNCEKFTSTVHTASALVRTLLCLASLIEYLLGEVYDLVLTSRFQSNPLEG